MRTTSYFSISVVSLSLLVCAVAGLAMPVTVFAKDTGSAPQNLEQLLQQVKNSGKQDAKKNASRVENFLSQRNHQKALLAKAKKKKTAAEAQSRRLQKKFERNDDQIIKLKKQRGDKEGNLGEMFGVLRQVAGSFAALSRNSMITAQYPDRVAFLDKLAQSKQLPPMSDLRQFWFEMQQQLTAQGNNVRFKATVVAANGDRSQQTVTRVGPFVAIANGKFLTYNTGEASFSTPPKQPSGGQRGIAQSYTHSDSGYHNMVIDPARGVLVTLISQRPTWLDRIQLGGHVGYIIIAIGLIGLLCFIYQFIFLTNSWRRTKLQLDDLEHPRSDNPLGRVFLAFKNDSLPEPEGAEAVELRVSEAVLRELPPIQRIQPFLKLVIAAGPLLGLIGTVIGMIETFQAIVESGSGDPKIMAAGIGHAMIATVLGLSIAIPNLFFNAILASRSKRLTDVLDEQSTGLMAETVEAQQES